MDKLPYEIILKILRDLKQVATSIVQYASISRTWQYAIEQTTFKSLRVFSLELDLFESAYRAGRYQHVRELTFYPVGVIDIHSNDPKLVDDVIDQASQSVVKCFDIIREHDTHEALEYNNLSLTIVPPQVFRKADVMFMNARPERLTQTMAQYIESGTHSQTLTELSTIALSLTSHQATVRRVSELKVFAYSQVEYDYMAVIEMVRACPNIHSFNWTYHEFLNREGREAKAAKLVSALCSLEMPQVNTVHFQPDRDASNIYATAEHDLSSLEVDVARTALRVFSSFDRLASLYIQGDFGPESFGSWSWPNLQFCHVIFRTFSPDGRRHFLYNPCSYKDQGQLCDGDDMERSPCSSCDESDDGQNQMLDSFYHHTLPNPDTVPATMVSLLVAIDRMPRLEQLRFENTDLASTCFASDFSMTYYGIGNTSGAEIGSSEVNTQRRVLFDSGNWRPSDAGEEGGKLVLALADLGMQHEYWTDLWPM